MSVLQSAAVDPERLGPGDRARFFRVARHDDLECLAARFERHEYALHTHETFVLGSITAGSEGFRYRGSFHVAGASSLVAVDPGELHDGRPVGPFFAYRMIYPSIRLLQRAAEELAGRRLDAIGFRQPVIDDQELAWRFAAMHRLLEAGHEPLAADSALFACIALAVQRHARPRAAPARTGAEPRALRRARDHLDAHLDRPVELAELAAAAGLSRFHLLRAFRRQVGTTPHGYLMDRRIARAKALMRQGAALADTALACGFYDQSHLTRAFKLRTGVPPGVWRDGNRLQDRAR